MTTDAERTLIFTDEAGAYYALPEAVLRQWRVPDEAVAALKQELATEDDVGGFIDARSTPVLVGFALKWVPPSGSSGPSGPTINWGTRNP